MEGLRVKGGGLAICILANGLVAADLGLDAFLRAVQHVLVEHSTCGSSISAAPLALLEEASLSPIKLLKSKNPIYKL